MRLTQADLINYGALPPDTPFDDYGAQNENTAACYLECPRCGARWWAPPRDCPACGEEEVED